MFERVAEQRLLLNVVENDFFELSKFINAGVKFPQNVV